MKTPKPCEDCKELYCVKNHWTENPDHDWVSTYNIEKYFQDLAQAVSDLQEAIRDIKRQTANLPKICKCSWHIPKDGICQNHDCKVCQN